MGGGSIKERCRGRAAVTRVRGAQCRGGHSTCALQSVVKGDAEALLEGTLLAEAAGETLVMGLAVVEREGARLQTDLRLAVEVYLVLVRAAGALHCHWQRHCR
jgi:hypothetical protein